jgi:hypothetical protein
VADCIAAEFACESAVQSGTHKKQAWAWQRYTQYCMSIGIKNKFFLKNVSQYMQTVIMGAYAVASAKPYSQDPPL